MKAAALPAGTASTNASRLAPLLDAVRSLGWRHLQAVLVVTLVITLARGATVLSGQLANPSWRAFATRMPVSAVCLVLGFVIADAYVRRGARPLRTYALGVVLAAFTAGVAVSSLWALGFGPPGFATSWATWGVGVFYSVILLGVQGGFGFAVWLEWREREAATRKARALELRRAEAERQLRQARLLALQARVEPELLFAALRRVGELTGTPRHDDAERLLDALIALLRLLMPGDRRPGEVATTVERELSIAVAVLRVHDGIAGACREVALSVDSSVAPLAATPMLGLPLGRALARRAAATPLRIRAERGTDAVSIVIGRGDAGDGEALLSPTDLTDLRRGLEDTLAADATGAVVAQAASTLTLRLPFAREPTTSDEPASADRPDR